MKRMSMIVMVLIVMMLIGITMAWSSAVSGPKDSSEDLVIGEEVVRQQVFPEGCVGYGFETFVTVFNLGNEPAEFSLVMCAPSEYYQLEEQRILPRERQTLQLNDLLPSGVGDVSLIINSDSHFVYSQMSMYWGEDRSGGGHTSTGFSRELGQSHY